MPRMRCRPKTSKLLKYSSLWFALKATQNSKLLRNDDFIDSEENEYLFNNNNDYIEINDSNCDLNGCVAETELMEQMSSHNESCVQLNEKFSRNSVNDVMNNTRLKAIDLIQIDTKTALVLINRKDSNYELTFGCLRMTSLTDNFHICVNGFTLMPNKTVELFAVFGYKLLINCQINELSHNQDFSEVENRLKSLELESKQIESLMSQINDKKSGIILIEKLCLSSLLCLENFENFKPLNIRSDSVWFELRNTGSHRFLKTDIWDTLFAELKLTKNDIIIVSGGKDVGKSSLIRYLVNKYLSQNSANEILYLDCDPGQSEFTTPGLLSLTLIDRPVLGPSSINAINFKPLMSSSIGVITANGNPKLYISCISYIMDYISNNLQSKGPLFINTMGWTRDLGLALLLDIIRITSPTHVIQIDSAIDPKKNFTVDLTSNSVLNYEGFKFGPFDGIQRLDYKLTVIESLIFKTNSTQAKTNRLLTQLSYISQMRDIIFKPISAITPFKINWSQVYLHIVSESSIAHELMIDILNLSWVQMCKIDEKQVNSSNFKENECIRVIDSLFENECFGCAIIRGIDIENKCFYLLSPESIETISSVNCLVRPSGIPIPEEVVFEQLKYSHRSQLPYIFDKT